VISAYWLEKRKPYWTRLEQLVASTGRRNVRALSHREIQELALLYRQAAADLARVREDPTGEELARYLNQLLGRAHNLIYMGRRAGPTGIVHFYAVEYPQIFRSTFPMIFAAFAIFIAGAVGGFLLSLANPGFTLYLLGPKMISTIEHHQMWTQSILTIKPLASSAIMTNNLIVCFTTFAMGITAGLGTIWMLLLNGLLFGVVNAACWNAGLLGSLWSFVAPHGVLELPAVFIAGGAGLVIARGMLFPGELPRRVSLSRAGSLAVKMVLGSIPLLIVAGSMEGFVSPSNLPPLLKYLVSLTLGLALVFYLTRRPSSASNAATIPVPVSSEKFPSPSVPV
jgi:uncharacterized membrane protein SpoIIM required for sporulation